MKQGHVHLKVSDLDESVNFYSYILGMKETERVANHYSFLTFGKKHHDLALQKIGRSAPLYRDYQIGLYHSAFIVKTITELKKVISRLKEKKVNYRTVDQGISKSVYFNDPDGIGVEVYFVTGDKNTKWQGYSKPLEI